MARDEARSEWMGIGAWFTRARERDWLSELPVWLFAAWASLLVLRGHLPYLILPVEQSLDEGYVVAIGQRMIHGHMLPYVDGAAHTGPVFLYTGALLAALGEFSWLPTRIFTALGFTLISVLVFASAQRAGRPFAGAIAAAGTPFYVTLRMWPPDGIAYNAELPAVVFTLASLYAGVRALVDEARPVSRGWLVAAGVFAGLGGLSKQIAATIVLPVIAYVLVNLYARRDLAPRERTRCTVAFLAGGGAVVALVFGWLALGGALRDAYYFMVTYNRYPYMAPYRGQSIADVYAFWMQARPLEMTLTLVSVSWGFGQLYAAWDRERSLGRALHASSFDWMVAAMALGGVIGARAARRDYDHYYIMIVPGFSLLLGILLERAQASVARPRTRAVYQMLIFAPVMLVGEVTVGVRNLHTIGWSKRENRMTELRSARMDPPLCRYIRAHSQPSDRLFVWGFRPQVHVSCARVPASRFVFSTMVAGFVPGFDWHNHLQDEQYVVPGSRETLARELAETRPPVIVESPNSMGGRLMRYAGPAWDYIEANYRRDKVIDGDIVYLRNDLATHAQRSTTD